MPRAALVAAATNADAVRKISLARSDSRFSRSSSASRFVSSVVGPGRTPPPLERMDLRQFRS
jgi:hypothetical protein